jgi:hypothetical protein
VAALFCPFVVLLGRDGADESGDGASVGEGADGLGAAADRAAKPLAGVKK